MKARKVVITLEVETDIPLSRLRRVRNYDVWIAQANLKDANELEILQAQANVVAPKKVAKKAAKKVGGKKK